MSLNHLTDILLDWETRQKDKPFLFAPETDSILTYGQLAREARHFVTYLDDEGISSSGHIGLYMKNGRQTTTVFLATMFCGRVITPLNLLAPIDQLAWVLDHSEIELLFYSPDNKSNIFAALEKAQRKIKLIELDPDSPHGQFMQHTMGDLPKGEENQPALLMYTSGTTGQPKGVLLTHANLLYSAHSLAEWHSLSEADIVLSSLPIYHINGQVISTIIPFVSGGSVVAPHSFSVTNWWKYAIHYRCTWINMVPTIIAYLINAMKSGVATPNKEDLQGIKFGRSASAPLPPEHHKKFENLFGIPIIEGMGMTESASMVFCNPHDVRRRYGSPGLPCGVEAKIIDAQGQILGAHSVGEICLRGENVMHFYYKNEPETLKVFDAEGWLKTGDLGMRDDDGFYFITGRLKELIIKGGENIAPREIDEIILKHPAVLDVAAVGISDVNYGQEIMACIILKQDAKCTVQEIKDFCQKELGKFRTPKHIFFMDELPRGPSGKVQRLKLLEFVKLED